MQVLLVVVLAPIDQHLANSEEILKLLKRRQAFRALRHYELRKHLIASSVSLSARSALLPH
jgi:hypothetical protein